MEISKINQHTIKYSLILLLLISIVLSGCLNKNLNTEADPTKVATTGIVVMETKPVQSPTPALTPTRQETTYPTITKTVGETPAPTPTITATWVPPTLNDYSIQTLIDTNGNCELPCWWGLVPGLTTKEQSLSFLEKVGIDNYKSRGKVAQINSDGKEVIYEQLIFTCYLPGGGNEGTMELIFVDNVVNYIAIDEDTAIYRYQLESSLNMLGKPDEILIYVLSWAPGTLKPYNLKLVYDNKNTLVSYSSDAIESEENIRICIDYDAPIIFMSKEDYGLIEKVDEITFGPESERKLQKLEVATNLSIDDFYEQFTNPGGSDCFDTSIEFWNGIP